MTCKLGHELTNRKDPLGGANRNVAGELIFSCQCGVYVASLGKAQNDFKTRGEKQGGMGFATHVHGATGTDGASVGEIQATQPKSKGSKAKRKKNSEQDAMLFVE